MSELEGCLSSLYDSPSLEYTVHVVTPRGEIVYLGNWLIAKELGIDIRSRYSVILSQDGEQLDEKTVAKLESSDVKVLNYISKLEKEIRETSDKVIKEIDETMIKKLKDSREIIVKEVYMEHMGFVKNLT